MIAVVYGEHLKDAVEKKAPVRVFMSLTLDALKTILGTPINSRSKLGRPRNPREPFDFVSIGERNGTIEGCLAGLLKSIVAIHPNAKLRFDSSWERRIADIYIDLNLRRKS